MLGKSAILRNDAEKYKNRYKEKFERIESVRDNVYADARREAKANFRFS